MNSQTLWFAEKDSHRGEKDVEGTPFHFSSGEISTENNFQANRGVHSYLFTNLFEIDRRLHITWAPANRPTLPVHISVVKTDKHAQNRKC